MKKFITLVAIVSSFFLGAIFTKAVSGYSSRAMKPYFSPEGGAEDAIIQAIGSARKEVLVAVYMFTSRPLASALVQAKARGVRVVVLVDKKQSYGKLSRDDDLLKKGVEVRYVPSKKRDWRSSKFHHKYAVIDGQVVITGSFNWTRAAHQINAENIVIIKSRGLSKAFRKDFVEWYKKADKPK